MKTLVLKTETIRVLQSSELDGIVGGVGKVSSALEPTSSAVSSEHKPVHHRQHAANPTATAVSSAQHLSSVLRR